LADFPENLHQGFLKEFSTMFYQVFALLEQAQFLKSLSHVNAMKIALTLFDNHELMDQCIKINKAFLVVLSKLFRSKLPIGQNLLWHDCKNKEENTLDPKNPHECECTILELYFRYMNFIDDKLQSKITDLFTELHRDYSFKRHILDTFCTYCSFVCPELKGLSEEANAKPCNDVVRMNAQIFGTEELCLRTIENNSI